MASNHFNRAEHRATDFFSAADDSNLTTNDNSPAFEKLHKEYLTRNLATLSGGSENSLSRTDQSQPGSALESLPEVTISSTPIRSVAKFEELVLEFGKISLNALLGLGKSSEQQIGDESAKTESTAPGDVPIADLMSVIQLLQVEITSLKNQLAHSSQGLAEGNFSGQEPQVSETGGTVPPGKGGPTYSGNGGSEGGGGKGGPANREKGGPETGGGKGGLAYSDKGGPESGGGKGGSIYSGKGGPAIDNASDGTANQSIQYSSDMASSVNSSPFQNPAQFFMTEMRDARWNPKGDLWSMNCGPATVATIIKGFGCRLTDSEDPQDLIVAARIAMTGRNAHEGTGASDVQRGLKAASLDTTVITDISQIDQALDAGGMVVLYGDPKRQGSYYNRMDNSVYGRITGAVTHWIPVVKRIDGGTGEDSYVVNDALSRTGPIVITRSELTNYLLKTPLDGKSVYGVAARKTE